MPSRSLRRLAILSVLAPLAAGCASGAGHVETLLKELNPLDVAVAAGVLVLANVPDIGWSTHVAGQGDGLYRIAVVRESWVGSGDGEFNVRFAEAALRVSADNSCGSYAVLKYAERYESALFGARRVAEGTIQCL